MGDLDADADTDVLDFGILVANFGTTGHAPLTEGDLDGDGDCDVVDFGIFAPNFGCQVIAPTITAVNATVLPRSGRVSILGSGFGDAGEVLIAGAPAWTTTWTDTRIVAYVPESAPLGIAPLLVASGAAQSDPVDLTVTARQPSGRVRWTFETDGDNQWWRPALAPDGTLYIHTNTQTTGLVYALSPDGGLKWVQQVNWYPYAPPTAGPDGAAYVGSIDNVYRLSAQGQIDWTFGAQEVLTVPTPGPDGGVYGAFEVTPGAYAINAAGSQLEWSNAGTPGISAWGMLGAELKFGRPGPGQPVDRFYLYFDLLWAFSLDGNQLFAGGAVNTKSHEPAVGSDGTIYAPGNLERYLVAYDPGDGHALWQVNSPWLAEISDMEIGPDDTLFFVSDVSWVEAYDPSRQRSVWRTDAGVSLVKRLSLSPDASTIVVTGGGTQSQVEFVKGFNTQNGREVWSVNLQEAWNPNFRHVPTHHARISADSSTAYVPTWTAQWPTHDGDPRAVLYAIDITR